MRNRKSYDQPSAPDGSSLGAKENVYIAPPELLKRTRPLPAWFEDSSKLPKRPPTRAGRP